MKNRIPIHLSRGLTIFYAAEMDYTYEYLVSVDAIKEIRVGRNTELLRASENTNVEMQVIKKRIIYTHKKSKFSGRMRVFGDLWRRL
jgi:hypothetical protein